MTFAESLILGVAVVAFLTAGMIHISWNTRVTSILQARHPETWAKLQGPILPSRTALADFMRSDMHQRMSDPELSRAIRIERITGRILMACFLGAGVTLFTLAGLPR
jgi:hypothetical protein